ncbi:Hypothetical protein FKW44_018800 [Caligus rogercresseyi]|uniref:Uncharacterized protein n=1 Tax=Caligus rogercresseyi TaxID=217165 RepID=A0A7T8GV26_CALRO|nr:Hypothetical protein FKW44_018800 [Caligus rogercresseyi]
MGPRVPPNLIGVFWGYISPPMGPGFCRTQSGCFGVTNPPPMGPWVRQTQSGVWG